MNKDKITVAIDNEKFSTYDHLTILQACEQIGKKIPTLCYLKNHSPHTTCMVCLVKIKGSTNLHPACTTRLMTGMDIVTFDEEIRLARQTALQLLLANHLGDCEAPCQRACPVDYPIPNIFKFIKQQELKKAGLLLNYFKQHKTLYCLTCKAPCIKACRVKMLNKTLRIPAILKILHNNYQDNHIKRKSNRKIFHSAFHSTIGRMSQQELQTSYSQHIKETVSEKKELTDLNSLFNEVSICLQCQCSKPFTCKLRTLGAAYHCLPYYFPKVKDKIIIKKALFPQLYYEPGKCIHCGICIDLIKSANLSEGLTFMNNSFNITLSRVSMQQNDHLPDEVLKGLVQNCPTGAFYKKKDG
ncbi:MAG: 2Fe-2S iron-sulfur cluster-binding protein [Spirochaetes bacterium]|nr:2Fe-2S iron-sulfur cluster-binding protein [Spirochaetota bacterium]